MPKENPLQGKPIRGNGENSMIAETDYKSNLIPIAAINSLERELTGLTHGIASLTIHVRDNHIARFAVSRERSFIPEQSTAGSREGNYGRDN